jgi:two-component system, response regulator PdtaR
VRILIAEDETIIRLDLRGVLERAGYEVCAEARDGREAVDLARDHRPDLALIDVKMPELDGIDAARMIMAERPIPIVLLTAYAETDLIQRAVRAGIFSYLVKPFREAEIAPAIETAWARHAEWLDARRDVGRHVGAHPERMDVVVAGRATWPLRLERRPDGSLDVSVLTDD